MAKQLLQQPELLGLGARGGIRRDRSPGHELLGLAALLVPMGCFTTYDLHCDEPTVSASSTAETPMLEDLGVAVEDFVQDLEQPRTGHLIVGDRNGKIPPGQPALDEPLEVAIELSYEREGELVTPDSKSICGLPYLRLPVSLTVRHGDDVLLTATGDGPVGWQEVGHPRADMDAVFEPKLWAQLGLDPPDEEQPLASMFVYYRDGFAESVDINLRYCDRSNPGCGPDFAHIVWEQ